MKTRFVLAAAPCVVLAIAAAAACSSSDLCVGAQCGGGVADASLGDGASNDATMAMTDGGTDPDAVAPPPGCDTDGDIPTESACVVDAYAFYVNAATSTAAAMGTKEAPYATINAAITAASSSSVHNVFICAGTYAEHVVSSANVNLYGGFDCATWTQPATAPATPSTIVAPSDTGYALQLNGASGIIESIAFVAKDGVDAGETSVAVFASMSNGVTFRRASITAGNAGMTPMQAAVGTNYEGPADAGVTALGAIGVAPQSCAVCTNGSSSIGGGSGSGGPTSGGNGSTGSPSIQMAPANTVPPHDGIFGVGASGGNGCSNGDPGAFSAGADGGSGAQINGTLESVKGWIGSAGAAGDIAGVAQGGGGGGGGIAAATGGGGGGGCGGCGGGGGAGGAAGGSSFAVLSYESTLTFDTCTVTAESASGGGQGGDGQAGQSGGSGGLPSTQGCLGGNGGTGGYGGGGGGGAGGLSVGIGFTGAKPTLMKTAPTFSLTMATGGPAGKFASSSGNGSDGVSASTYLLPSGS